MTTKDGYSMLPLYEHDILCKFTEFIFICHDLIFYSMFFNNPSTKQYKFA